MFKYHSCPLTYKADQIYSSKKVSIPDVITLTKTITVTMTHRKLITAAILSQIRRQQDDVSRAGDA